MKKIMKLGVIALIASAFAFTACENESTVSAKSTYDVDLASYYSFTPAVTSWSACIDIIPAGETITDGAVLTLTLEPQSNVASWGATFKYLKAGYAGSVATSAATAAYTHSIDGAKTETKIAPDYNASAASPNDCFNVSGNGTHTITITLTGDWLTLVETYGLGITGDGTYKVASAKLDY